MLHVSLKEVYGKSWPMLRITESHDSGAGKGVTGPWVLPCHFTDGEAEAQGKGPLTQVPQQVNWKAGTPIQLSSQAARLQPRAVSPGSSWGAVALRQAAVF